MGFKMKKKTNERDEENVIQRIRDAITGRFVESSEEEDRADTTMRDTMDLKKNRLGKKAYKVVRDTITGRFVKKKKAKKHPKTTVRETIYR